MMPGLLLPYHILSLSLLGQLVSCLLVVDIPISQLQPETAVLVSQSFVSFSIEGDLWPEWMTQGTSPSRNNFFFNALDNLQRLTGVPPRIRIGANSADNTAFGGTLNVSTLLLTSGVKSLANRRCQVTETIFPNATTRTPYPEARNVSIDDAYYEAAQFLPQSMSVLSLSRFSLSHISIGTDTLVTWGVNLKQDNLPAALLEAMVIVKAFSSPSIKGAGILLEAIEIGNEPDLYPKNGARSSTYTVSQYVSECVLYLSISLSTRSIFTHTLPLCQMERVRWHDCINPIICRCNILGCVFCSVFAFYQRFFATSYLRGGDY